MSLFAGPQNAEGLELNSLTLLLLAGLPFISLWSALTWETSLTVAIDTKGLLVCGVRNTAARGFHFNFLYLCHLSAIHIYQAANFIENCGIFF